MTFYIDVYAATSKKRFIELYSKAIADEMDKDLNRAVKLIKELLPGIIPAITVKPGVPPSFEFEFKGTKKNVTSILDDVYEAIPKYTRRKKKKAVVVFFDCM